MAWIVVALLSVAVVALSVRFIYVRKDIKRLSLHIEKSISLGITEKPLPSSSNKRLNALVDLLNGELSGIRELKSKCIAEDRELKEAVTNIAHDLRTPLTAIYGYLDLLSKTEDPEETERYISAIENRVSAITHLTEALFEYTVISSSSALSTSIIDVRRILEDALIAGYPIFEQKGITPSIEIPGKAVACRADPVSLSRVFENIISNAAKYGEKDFFVVMTEKGEISFSNHATGLSQIDVSKLFDRFFTADPSRRSTGLGLSIAKTLAEQMGGSVKAEYAEGVLKIILSLAQD